MGKGKRKTTLNKQSPASIPTVKDFVLAFNEEKQSHLNDEDYDIVSRTNGTVSIYTLIKKH